MLVLKRDKGNTIRPQKQHFAKKMLPAVGRGCSRPLQRRFFVCICVRGRFGSVRNVSLQQNANKFAFALDFSYFGFALDTPSRQCSNKIWHCARLFVSLSRFRLSGRMRAHSSVGQSSGLIIRRSWDHAPLGPLENQPLAEMQAVDSFYRGTQISPNLFFLGGGAGRVGE